MRGEGAGRRRLSRSSRRSLSSSATSLASCRTRAWADGQLGLAEIRITDKTKGQLWRVEGLPRLAGGDADGAMLLQSDSKRSRKLERKEQVLTRRIWRCDFAQKRCKMRLFASNLLDVISWLHWMPSTHRRAPARSTESLAFSCALPDCYFSCQCQFHCPTSSSQSGLAQITLRSLVDFRSSMLLVAWFYAYDTPPVIESGS